MAMVWDDLRFFIAIAQEGSASGAARQLGVNYSTVLRRLASLEEHYGAQLFERSGSGYEATSAGGEVLEIARGIEQSFQELDRQLSGRDARLSGTIRVSTTDLLAEHLMIDFKRFSDNYPDIQLEVSTSSVLSNLTKRDADVAIRLSRGPAPEHMAARHVGLVPATLYGSKSYFERVPGDAPLDQHAWIGWDENHGGGATARSIQAYVPAGGRIACRVDSGIALRDALRVGMGLGFIWRFIGDADPALERMSGAQDYYMDLILLTHRDLEKTPRFRAFLDFMEGQLTGHPICAAAS